MLLLSETVELLTAFVAFLSAIHTGAANIDCFKCVSVNWDNPACDDPFHNNYTLDILESPCMGGRKGRNGVFPATACIKMTGYYDDTGDHITVRHCALDSGTLTTDTELIRMSHCGGFYFDDRYVRGCLQSCMDTDACNSGPVDFDVPTDLLLMGLTTATLYTSLLPHRSFVNCCS
ncbi:unnamed protein product [Bemisia tabaci]|uniref:Protein quiver n=1 Tax=Bemisia tabaci TaxID=7038 RepID=A0A9P0F1I5_BEMTA|nr:PREDICTED: uncharacterized protein LOC109029718 [Bemisia tabaci]XP_018895852.1 PREDICTED: uncharacterized protein LOC109029718 [Bemisia tabaci]CAH0384979.1 unnamed protein product [Bemisia tabaci]